RGRSAAVLSPLPTLGGGDSSAADDSLRGLPVLGFATCFGDFGLAHRRGGTLEALLRIRPVGRVGIGLSGEAQPKIGQDQIFLDAASRQVEATEVVLCIGLALLGRHAIPAGSRLR